MRTDIHWFGADVLDVSSFAGINAIGDLNNISQDGLDALIDINGTDMFRLQNRDSTLLDGDDFNF